MVTIPLMTSSCNVGNIVKVVMPSPDIFLERTLELAVNHAWLEVVLLP